MSHNLKAFSLTLAAMLAIGAVATALPAQATPVFETEVYPATLDGESTGQATIFKLGSAEIECEKSTFSGTLATVGGKPPSAITISRSYSNCTTKLNMHEYPTTVEASGCAFVIHATEKVDAINYKAHVDIECQTGGEIEFRIYESKETHESKQTMCEYTIPAQTGLTSVNLVNKNAIPADVTVSPLVSGIKYEVDGPLGCGFGGTKGTYTGSTTMTATNGGTQWWIKVAGE